MQLPLVRLVARRRMRSLFDLCSGFVYSQVLLACTRLGLFDILARSPCTVAELAAELDLPVASVARLLEAAESLQLVEPRGGGRYGLGPLGAALRGNPAVVMMIEHHAAFYQDLADPIALLRGDKQHTELGRFWAYSRSEQPSRLSVDDTASYSRLMAASQELIADQILAAYPVHRHQRLLDVGGGAGAFAAAAMHRAAALRACVFDLPAVVEQARTRFERLGLGERASVVGGDFLKDRLPAEHDLVSLVRILHDHDDDAALRLLKALREAMTKTSVLMIAEPMLGTRGAEPVTAAYFGFYLLAMGQGRPRSRAAISDMLRQAGFTSVKEHRTQTPLLLRVLTARPI